ncbi:chromate efflux transporter [Fundidesulfovibrio terrae]|uniref:chromate efflux transporter n=1 Tax=Fundidesulfovibrio terrae TaxID=2922866 RepID=UPI001FAF679A|nr:chromate efflux transporter [Fundidesulfovibrio terrae]
MDATVSFAQALRYWFKLGFINFGGPAGQIAMMHKDLVDGFGWIEEKIFLRALNLCMLLPGPEAHQLAIYLGWRLNGYRGGIAAGVFFLLPSVVLMLGLSWLTMAQGGHPVVAGIFHGIAAAVVAIVVEAVLKIGKKALRHRVLYAFAGAAFILGQVFQVAFPWIVLAAGIGGLVLARLRPDIFCRRAPGSKDCVMEEETGPTEFPSHWHIFKVIAVFLVIWAAVTGPVFLSRGMEDILSRIALFFTKAPFVTFGGAYAVLSYITDFAVRLDWLTEKEMLAGLGLAETTPGPLIMVTQFVGFVAAWNNSGAANPAVNGMLGGLVTTFCTFLPSFLFIFALAPYIEAITSNKRLTAALTGITAAVVGVVLKLAVFFAWNTFFPKGAPADIFSMVLTAACFLAIWKWKPSIHVLVLGSGAVGLVWQLI